MDIKGIFNVILNVLFLLPYAHAGGASCDASISVPTSGTATWTTPNYPNHYDLSADCKIAISGTSGYIITIAFDAFDLETGATCSYDSLTIHDGSSSAATSLGSFCGTSVTSPLQSSSNAMYLVFTTDATITKTGISATFTLSQPSSCNLPIYVSILGTFSWSTPNYPSNYGKSTTCNIAISGPTDYGIMITFNAFALEYATYCNYDSLSVYDGSSSAATLLGSYCGTTNPGSVTATSNAMYMVFSSDYSIVATGISATLTLVDVTSPGCKAGYTTYAATPTVQTFSPQVNSLGRYLSNTDEYFLVTNANSATTSLILQLSAMDVERGTNCPYDRIIIYDGDCTSSNVLTKHCGSYLTRWELTGAEYLVQFHTDSSVQKAGFTMQYYTGVASTAAPTTTTTLAGAAIADVVGLVQGVLANYTADNSPRRDFTQAISSTVNLALVGINGLDENEQVLTTTIAFDISWQDAYMEWPEDKFPGVTSLLIPQDDMWKPDITLMNGVEKITQMGASFMFVHVINNGSCQWKPYQILKSVCNTGMSKYPYDVQKCDIKFSTWSSSGSDVTTVIGTNGMQKHADFVGNSEWTLLDITQSTETIDGKNIAVFTVSMQRNQAFVVFYIMIPVVMLSLLNVFTFALPVTSGEKSGFGMTVFLSFVVYLIVTFQKLPANSEALSLFAIFLLANSLISAITVMISCLEIRLITLSTKHRPLGCCARGFTSCIEKIQMRMLCMSSNKENIESFGDESNGKDDGAWPKFVSALDFTLFFVFLVLTTAIIVFFMLLLAE